MSDGSTQDPAHAALRAYHDASKHRPRRYAPGPGYLDWASQPLPFRQYDGAPAPRLPLQADGLDVRYAELRSGAVTPRILDRDGVALLFELSLGLSAWKQYGGQRWALRCNPSSGNLHPTEAYLVAPALEGLEGGVYHYRSLDHALERRAAPTARGWDEALNGAVLVGLTSVHWREAWKYGLRAWRYCQLDLGHALAALTYAAAALGWRARLVTEAGDDDVARLLGLDRDRDFPVPEEREAPDCLVRIGPAASAADIDALARMARAAQWAGAANRLSHTHRQWDGIAAVQQATGKPRDEGSPPSQAPILPPLRPAPTGATAADLIRQRRSAVAFDATGSMTAEAFVTLLDALLPRAAVPPWDALAWEPRIHPVFFVHRIAGIAPGLYVLPRASGAEARLRAATDPEWLWEGVGGVPGHIPLRLLTTAHATGAAKAIACHQDIAADSCFAVGMLADFDRSMEEGSWWYRRLYAEAGMLGQALYLEAEAAGLRGTGIGCFFDDEMHGLLGLRNTAFQSLYHFTVGRAVEDVRLATLAPYASVRAAENR